MDGKKPEIDLRIIENMSRKQKSLSGRLIDITADSFDNRFYKILRNMAKKH